jgi:general secretion pathway protein J
MIRRHSGREAGFALVESIAVLALSGLVLATLVISTDLVSRNSAAAARSANTIETLATGFAAVRRDLQGARFIRIGAKPEDPILFSGGATAIAMAVADDGTEAAPREGLVLIEARYEEGRGALVRSSAPLLPGTTGFGAAKFVNPAVLLSGPWKYRFSYYDPQGDTEHWHFEWTATNRMPSGIRVEVLDDAGQKVVSALVAPIRIDSGGCAEAAHVDCTSLDSGGQDQSKDQNGDPDLNQKPDPNQKQ